MNSLTNKIAQITLALALTLGCSLGVQAASLEKATFGQTIAQTMTDSKTAKPSSSMDCLDEKNILIIDPHIDPVLGREVNMVKYAFDVNELYNVEINFKSNSLDDYLKLVAQLQGKYGKGKETDEVIDNKDTIIKNCVWELEDKKFIVSYVESISLKYKRFNMDITSGKAGVSVIKDFTSSL